jgi:hypothetical protein
MSPEAAPKYGNYFFSRLIADAFAADLSSFTMLVSFPGLTLFFAGVFFFPGFAFGCLVDFFTMVLRN